MNRILFLLSVLVVAACGGGGGGDGGNSGGNVGTNPPAPPARTPETVVFVAADDQGVNGATQLFAIEDDGTNQRMLSEPMVSSDSDIRSFQISPDGQWVAYLADHRFSGQDVLYVASIDGSSHRQVSLDVGDQLIRSVKTFDWAPDSQQLVYSGNMEDRTPVPGADEVYLVNRDGSAHQKINGFVGWPAVVSVLNPQFSPDGRYIIQEVALFDPSTSPNPDQIFAINIHDTSVGSANIRRVVTMDGNRRLGNVSWSPDSERIAYRADQEADGIQQLYVINAAQGGGNVRVTDNGTVNSVGRWSPDGAEIAHLDNPTQPLLQDLLVSPGAAGTDRVLVSLSPAGGFVTDYQWSPDGASIAYVANQDTRNIAELYVVPSAGGTSVKINGPFLSTSDVLDFSWSADGRRIAYTADQDVDEVVELFVSATAGGGNQKVSTMLGSNEVQSFAWSPDSTRLAYSTAPVGIGAADALYVAEPGETPLQLDELLSRVGSLEYAP